MPPPDILIVNAYGDNAFLIDGDIICINPLHAGPGSKQQTEMGQSASGKGWPSCISTGFIFLIYLVILFFAAIASSAIKRVPGKIFWAVCVEIFFENPSNLAGIGLIYTSLSWIC
jgi:hypothetical protein